MNRNRTAAEPAELDEVMVRDRWPLRSQWQQIERAIARGKDQQSRLQQWNDRLSRSKALRKLRRDSVPDINIDPTLPIAEHAEAIGQAIVNHQVIVVSGATGSGKSTQLPLICLQLGLADAGFIGHTQPRRIAARSVANRIAELTGSRLGDLVGYKIRFADQTDERSLVKVMTDGILLAETQSDRMLNQYSVLIIDEAHERSLNIDFILAYLRQLIRKRSDLKIIITSATIDTEKFAEHFSDQDHRVPVIDVPGRTYPVEIFYRPPGMDDAGLEIEEDIDDAVVNSILDIIHAERGIASSGDILTFLPTEQDIRNISRKLRGIPKLAGVEVLPLYARLSTEQQNQIFQPHNKTRVVLATNVAESSITVPGIRYVVDTGSARISRFAPRSKVQRLPIEAISQASADQRAGRCGRLGPGVCLRLYAEDDYHSRPRFTTPEIRRTSLASVILKTMALDMGLIEEIPFIDPPTPEAVREGYRTLFEIGATDDSKQLTELGRRLSRLPTDPRIGRMLFAANELRCLSEILIIASALELQDPRVRPPERAAAADAAHEAFKHPDSDFMSLLQLWDFLHDLKERLSQNKFRKACAQNFISYSLVRQWQEIHRQLKSLCQENGLRARSRRDEYDAIHQALLSGLLSGIALKSERRQYTGAGGLQFRLWPGTGISQSGAEWILVGEMVETSQRYGRTAAKIDPSWVEPLASHLVKLTRSDPFWSKNKQSAMINERVSLFGLPIVARRPVRLPPLDPDQSRKLLIEAGLIRGELRQLPEFLIHNQHVLDEIQSGAARTRRRSWIVDEQTQFGFYDTRLPESAVDVAALNRLLGSDPTLRERLKFTVEDLLSDTAELAEDEFPSELELGQLKLPVEYVFEPGASNDGATVLVPLEGFSQIHDNHLGWAVPGLMVDRVTALIRSLPKSIRRNLIPAPDTAREVAQRIEFGRGSFYRQVAEQLGRLAETPITPEMFRQEKIDRHLQLNVQVVDEDGSVVAEGRDLAELRRQLPETPESQVVQTDDHSWHQDDLIDWNWNRLEEQFMVRRGTAEIPVYPAVVDGGECVALRLFDHPFTAEQSSRRGLATLYFLSFRKQIRSQVNWLPDLDGLAVKVRHWFAESDERRETGKTSIDALKWQLGHLMSRLAFVESKALPRTREDFELRKQDHAERISMATQQIASWLKNVVEHDHQVQLLLYDLRSRFGETYDDIHQQLEFLFQKDFLLETPWKWLRHYPRYLQAIEMRIDRLKSGGGPRDSELMGQINELLNRLLSHLGQDKIDFSRLQNEKQLEFVWMLQEFRVSLFAQQLGTSEKVSATRLERLWNGAC